ncbi:MAG: hypothetical protein IJS90_07055 [Clostridia bacterium]|nr:hypothetical protein [Clostridia bacterium]
MKELREIKAKLLSDKKALGLIGIFLFGLCLLFLSGTSSGKTKTASVKTDDGRCEIERELEQRAERLLSGVDGVGKVKILITVESVSEDIFAQDEQRDVDSGKSSEEYVIVDEKGSKTGLRIKTLSPAVKGIAVCCEGGGNANVRGEVTKLMCAAFGVGANRVYVSKLQ